MNRNKNANTLIKAIQRGDVKALETFYADYGAFFLNIAKMYLFDPSLADDLLSEVFFELVKNKASSFNPRFNGLNWMVVIIKHKAYKYNSRNIVQFYEANDFYRLSEVLQQDNWDSTFNSISLRVALESLTDYENKLLFCRYWEGLTVREIAKKFKKPSSTIYYELSKTLAKLKVVLE